MEPFYYTEHGVTNEILPPWWVGMIPSFKRIWDNPVNQFLATPLRSYSPKLIIAAFISGLVLSIALNITIMQASKAAENFDNFIKAGFYISIIGPIAVIAVIAGIRIFHTSLIMNTIRIERIVKNKFLATWFNTPLDDRAIFNSIVNPPVVNGYAAFEWVIGLAAGLVIPFLFITYRIVIPEYGGEAAFSPIDSSTAFTYLLWLILSPVFLSLTVSRLSTIFSLHQPIQTSLTTTSAATIGLAAFIFSMRLGASQVVDNSILVDISAISFLFLIAWLLRKIGEMEIAKLRRPGFYEPEYASAAGLL